MPRRSAMLLAALALARPWPALAAACRAEAVASVPLGMALGLWTVPVTIDGQPATFVLDTGADRTLVSRAAARRLGLKPDEWVSSAMRGVGGVEWRANVTARSLVLGGVALRRPIGPPIHSFPVMSLPWLEQGDAPISGLLGADYLAAFDLDIDPVRGRLTLQAMQGCSEGVALPWALPHAAVRVQRPRRGLLLVPVTVDRVGLTAQLDTGSTITLLSRKGIARLGTPAPGQADRFANGIGPQALALSRRRAESLAFGPLALRDVDLAVGAPAGGFPFDMLLGLDVLRRQRLWISYATNQVLLATP